MKNETVTHFRSRREKPAEDAATRTAPDAVTNNIGKKSFIARSSI
jgi:hypothetical protein